MDLKLKDKVALVTGGSRGIGRSIVTTLAGEGCDILAVARSTGDHLNYLPELAERTRRRIEFCQADLTTIDGVAKSIKAAQKHFGRLDILVNNAGNAKRAGLFELTEADWEEAFALKFFATMRMTREAWPLLKSAGGTIINVIGVSGRTPPANYVAAASVNAGLYAFTKAMSEAGMEDGIRINAVNPGAVETDRLKTILENMNMPESEARPKLLEIIGAPAFGTPDNIADMVAFLASPRAEFINGALIDIDAGRTRAI